MRFCTNCNRLTAGQPQFCNYCGRSFDVKLCPRLHINSRAALVCSQCGARELSTPQPKVSLLLRPVVMLVAMGPGGLLLLLLAILFVVFVQQLLSDPNGVLPLIVVAAVVALALKSWMKFNNKHKQHR